MQYLKWQALICAACMSGVAVADVLPSGNRVQWGIWSFVPVYEQDANNLVSVVGLLAVVDAGQAVGQNLEVVWYERSQGGWSATAWPEMDPWAVVEQIKVEFAIDDQHDELWGVGLAAGVGPAGVGQPYVAGLLEGDPLLPIVTSAPNGAHVVEEATQFGYQSATIGVDWAIPCTDVTSLDSMAASMLAWIESGEDDVTLNIGGDDDLCFPLAGIPPISNRPPKPANPPGPNPPGSNHPGGGPPPGSDWIDGPWSPSWSCRETPIGGGAVTCSCTRKKRWGRWERHSCWLIFTCDRWVEVIETERCQDVQSSGPCVNPPASSANCTQETRW